MKSIFTLGFAIAITLLAAGCGHRNYNYMKVDLSPDYKLKMSDERENSLYSNQNELLSYHFFRTQEVADIDSAYRNLEQLIVDNKGYYLNIANNCFEFAVPGESVESVLAAVEKLGKTTDERLTSQDITLEYRYNADRLLEANEQLQKMKAMIRKNRQLMRRTRVVDTVNELQERLTSYTAGYMIASNKLHFARISVTLTQPQPE